MKHIAVVILNYNGLELLKTFLEPVIRYSGNAQVIVADNGSTDGSSDWLHTHHPEVTLIPFTENYGFCGGYNQALRQVSADYYVLLNSDVLVTENWLEPLVAILDSDSTMAAIQPKILAHREPHRFEYAGAGGGFVDLLGYPFCRGRLFDSIESDTGQYNDTIDVFWTSGACMMIRAECYHEHGGLDEDFFAHMEEIDLAWKLHRGGWRLGYTGAAKVYHVGAGTLGYGSPTKIYLNFRNGLFLLFRHTHTRALGWKLPLRLALDWVAGLRYLLTGAPKQALAVFRAHKHFIKFLSREIQKRQELRSRYADFAAKSLLNRILIWDYFVLGRKKSIIPDRTTLTQVFPDVHQKGQW